MTMGVWKNKTKSFMNSECGPTAIEYAVMLALVILVCMAAISAL